MLVQDGELDIKAKRDRAYAILADLETAIVADPTLGGVVSSGHLLPSEQRYEPRSNEAGAYVRIVFVVSYTARI